MVWSVFFLGVVAGVVVMVPVAYLWNRRTEVRARQLEQRARTAERLAEFGTLTSGLAHEIKNPLSTIGLNVQLIREDLEEVTTRQANQNPPPQTTEVDEADRRLQRRFDSLARETEHLRSILDDFLRFAGRMNLDREPTDLDALVAELADFFEPQARQAGVQLRTQFAASSEAITGPLSGTAQERAAIADVDAGLVKQALLNLLINAVDAMQESREKGTPNGGGRELILRTQSGRHLDEDEIQIHVIDTGPGLATEVAQRVFQPYYSTKGGGSGLGLPTARRIAEEHGGRLTVHSEVGRGTDFTLCLPVNPPADDSTDSTAVERE